MQLVNVINELKTDEDNETKRHDRLPTRHEGLEEALRGQDSFSDSL